MPMGLKQIKVGSLARKTNEDEDFTRYAERLEHLKN